MPEGQLFNPEEPNMWEPDLPVPTPEEHDKLMDSPVARLARVALRSEQLPPPDRSRPRGRRREEVASSDKLDLAYPDIAPEDQLSAIGKYLVKAEVPPLLDSFTSSAGKLRPTKDSLDAYAMAWSVKPAKHPGDKRTPLERRQALQRRTQHIADELQLELMLRTELAALRAHALHATRHQLRYGQPTDAFAARHAADALTDFGHKIEANSKRLFDEIPELTDKSLPVRIKQIGERAVSDPTLLGKNLVLLKLAHLEQDRQYEHWRPIYEASKRYHGDRLTKEQKSTLIDHHRDIRYLSSLSES